MVFWDYKYRNTELVDSDKEPSVRMGLPQKNNSPLTGRSNGSSHMFKESENNLDSLCEELRHYCDELSEFNRRCERLCQALADIATHHESISSFSVRGMRGNANWLRYRINDFNKRLYTLYEKALDEQQ